LDLERFEDENASLSLQAAGGNTRLARKLRVKSQLRDKKGRWVEMGRGASVDVKINGKKTKVRGRFVGSDPKAPGVRGLFLVEADEARGIKRGVYSFKGRAVNQVLASLDPEYLEEQGIDDPNRDVNGNLNGFTLDEDIEELSQVDFEEAGELDEALASGKLSSDEVAQAFNERSRAGAHESYNVVATLEEADTEVLTEEELEEILEDVGVTPEAPEAPKAPETSAPKVEDLPRQIGRDATRPDDRVPDSTPPMAILKTANRLVPGDIVKMPDGTTRKVVRNNSVDSGSLVSFEPKAGERRGTYRTYSDDDLVEIEQPTQEVKAEIPTPAPETAEPVEPTESVEQDTNLPTSQHDEDRVRRLLSVGVADLLRANKDKYPGLDIEGFVSLETEDPDVKEAIDMAYFMSDIIERSGSDDKDFLYQQLAEAIRRNQEDKARLRPTKRPDVSGRADTVRKITARKEGTTIDPITMKQPRTGISVAVQNTNEEIADALFFNMYLGDMIVADYVDRNKDRLRNGFKLGTWHDEDNNEVTFDIVEVFPAGRVEEATVAGQDRNQQGIFNLKNKEFIPTGGTGDRGRARKQREAQRAQQQGSDGRGAGPELGQPEPIGEVREGQEPTPGDAEADGSGRDQLSIDRGSGDLINVPTSKRGELDYGDLSFDMASLNARQRQILKKIDVAKKSVFARVTDAAKKKDQEKFERNLTWGKALKDTFNRVFGDLSNGLQLRFGQGEKERLKNMTFFSNTEQFDENGRMKELQGVYVARNGEAFALKFKGDLAGIYRIGPNGETGSSSVAHVSLNWNGESSRGDENDNYASIRYLASNDGGKGLAGAAVTFARYVVEASGKNFAHSYNLTPQGSNNSKTIEPGDPRRHHYSQSEKVLQVMGAPTIDLLNKQGWFTGRYSIFAGDYLPINMERRFLSPLDVSGRKNNVNLMLGPVYKIDKGLAQILTAYKNNVEKQKREYNNDVATPSYFQDFAENKGFGSYRLQFDMEELNWQDGPSKESVIQKLKNTEDLLTNIQGFFSTLEPSQRVGFMDYSSGLQVDTLRKNYASIREGLEADADFDSKRLPRPDSLDRALPARVELKVSPQTFREVDARGLPITPAFEGVSAAFNLNNFDNYESSGGAYATLSRANYATILDKPAGTTVPAGWTSVPSVLARRFSVEELRESLETLLQRNASSEVPITGEPSRFFAELDFRREFATEPLIGNVPALSVARALYKKSPTIDGVEFKEYLAEQIDKAFGIQLNIEKLESERQANKDFFQKMDDYLKQIGETREDSVEEQIEEATTTPRREQGANSYYDSKDAILRSEGMVDEASREEVSEYVSSSRLIDNEKFDQLPNDLGQILTEPATRPDADEASQRFRAGISSDSISATTISLTRRHRRENLIEAFKDAIVRGNSTIRVENPSAGGYSGQGILQVELDIRTVRDVLQTLNVDTNELIRSEVLPRISDSPNLTPEQIRELHRQGLLEPRSVSDIIAKANEVVDLDNFESVRTFGEGSSRPEQMVDNATGKQYVVKRYENQLIAEMEITTQALYQAAGVNASNPRFGRLSNDASGHYVVTDFVPVLPDATYRGRITSSDLGATFETQAEARQAVLNGLPMDILLDNIDGPYNGGNIIYDADGGYIRIDGGGALLSDPLDRIDDKKTSRRYNAMSPQGWNGEATDEQTRVLKIAKTYGSFEGPGIEFTYDLYLNPMGWHWNWEGGLRRDILENFDEDKFKQSVRDTILPLTPDKITEIVDNMPITSEGKRTGLALMEPDYKQRIKEALIYRRAHMLNKFGIEDTYNPQERELASTPANDSDRERLDKYVNDAFKNENSVERDSAERTVSNPNTTKEQIENTIEELRPLITEKSEDDATEDSSNEVVEILNSLEEKPDSDDLPVDPIAEFTTNFIDLSQVEPGDIINDSLITTENGRVIFNTRSEDGNYKIGIRNERGELFVFDHNPATLRHMRYVNRYTSESKIPPETDFNASRNSARERFIANIKNRSNKVLEAVKEKYVNHTQLANGDLVVSSRTFNTAGGRSYKYQLVVHRKADEEFVAYVREWEIGRDGAAISPVRINKMTNPTHSPKALLNRIQPLVKGSGVGQGIYGRNPRNWFNQGNSIEGEVSDPRTGMPIPNSLSVDPNTQYIEDTGIRSTGDPVKDAVISYVGRLVSRGVTASDIYRRLGANTLNIFSRSKILDIIERVESNRAFPGINQIPYLSRNKRDIVRVGDRVRHYAPNGTVKEGTVRLRRPLSVSRKPNGDYEYTDVLVVKFDGREQGTPIVAKNLEVIRRSDGEAPDLGGEIPAELPIEFTPDMMTIPASWSATVAEGDSGNVRFDGPDDAPLLTIGRITDPFGRMRFILHSYPSINEGRNARTEPKETYRFVNLPTALATVEVIIGGLEEEKAQKNESSAPASQPVKAFQNAEGDTDLDEFVEAVRKNVSDSPCALTASVEACDITQAMRVRKVSDGDAVEVYHGDMAEVDAKNVPTYWVFRTGFFGKGKRVKKVAYWLDKDSVGDMSKARWMHVPKNLTMDEVTEKIRKEAEERINFARGIKDGKSTRTLSIDLGNGETFNEEVDFETWKMLSLSPVSKAHFTLGNDGTIKISESRLKYYQEQVKFHLSGIEPPSGRSPIMFVFGGSPASGKGGFTKKNSALSKMVKGETPQVREFNPLTGLESPAEEASPTAVLVDPDVFKVRLPEVRLSHIRQIANRVLDTLGLKRLEKENKSDNKWANDSHEESSLMAKMVTKAAQDAGLDIVLDAVNAEKSKIKKKADQAREKGYKVIGRYLEASFAVTMPSAAKRSFNTGREVPIDVQLSSLKHLTQSLGSTDNKESKIWDIFDDFELFHREGSTLTEIATWRPDQKDPNQLNFTGKNRTELEKARDLHNEYIRMASLSQEERDAEIDEIRKRAQDQVDAVLERQKHISSGQPERLQKVEDALATDIELEVMALLKALEVRYPGYSVSNLANILKNLIDDLGTGKISDKEFGKLIGEAASDFKKGKKEVDLRELGKNFVDTTGFYKNMVG
jgi:hypothetical protein